MSGSFGGPPQGYSAQDQRRPRAPERARQAAGDLAQLMRDKLNMSVDPIALRLFLQVYWSRVETLAHTIHDNEER